jgi:hypothetical protein
VLTKIANPAKEQREIHAASVVKLLGRLHRWPHAMSGAAQAMRRSRATLEPNVATRALFANQYRRFLRMQGHRRA